jgi:hypothetical protein
MLVVIDAEDCFDAAPQLHRITAPTLVSAGERDRYYTPELFWQTTEGIPGARRPRNPRLPDRRRAGGRHPLSRRGTGEHRGAWSVTS